MADYIYTMESRLTPDQMKGVNLVQEVALAHGFNVYLTGGAIRDILTGFAIKDLDFTVQGNPFKFQKDLERHGAKVDGVDEELKSLHVILPGNVRAEISMARAEIYDKPGKAPAVSPATIQEDLRRRDFTINAMALSLNTGSRGLLLDPSNGSADIESKLIRILHNYAFLEEPSRLIRATRFCARFQWEMDERTRGRYDAAKEGEYIQYLRRDQIGYEIEQLGHEDDAIAIAKALEKEGWLKHLNQHLSIAKMDVASLQELMKIRQTMNDFGISVDAAPATLHFITAKLPDKDIAEIQKLLPHKEFLSAWKHLEDEAKDLAKKLQGKEAATNSGAWKILTECKPEALLYLNLTTKQKVVEEKIKNFFGKWREHQQKLPFLEMAEMRITPQLPEYPKIAQEAFLLLLDGKLRNHNEIVKFLEPFSPPPPPPPPPAPAKRGRGAKAAKKVEVAPVAVAPEAASAPVAVIAEKAKPGKNGKDAKPEAVKAAPKTAKEPSKPVAKVAEKTKVVEKAKAQAKSSGNNGTGKAHAKPAAKPVAKKAKPAKPVPKPAAKKHPAPKKATKPAPKKVAKKKK